MTMEIKMETVVKRFRDYISFNTQSDEANDKECPSTPGQMVLAKHLADELRSIGLTEVTVDEHGYVMATLPANNGDDSPVVGFISHLDTSPDAAGGPIHEQIIHAYAGGDIVLNEEKGIVFSVADFPGIERYKGQDIMMTDGTTLLGADDKAGVTAIVSAAEYLMAHPEISHGKIRLGFTPDEETGRSADRFDVKAFGADFAYTVDGGEIGGLEYENFNAANPTILFHGRSVHTGDAKGKMKNAVSMAAEWQQMLPAGEKPEYTEGHEGFFHVHTVAGSVELVTMEMLVRDHDARTSSGARHCSTIWPHSSTRSTARAPSRCITAMSTTTCSRRSRMAISMSWSSRARRWRRLASSRMSSPSAAALTAHAYRSWGCRARISSRAVRTSTAALSTCRCHP